VADLFSPELCFLRFNKWVMKKVLLFFVCVICGMALRAQEPADALRFSWTVPGGTARSQAIGGAMGSLGGDVSATFVNPAGLAFYKTGDFVFTPKLSFGNNKATYFDRTEKEKANKMTWGTTGFVTGVGSDYRRTKNVAISIAYNRSADFNSSVLYRGANNRSSFSQQYVDELNNSGVRDSSAAYLFPFGASQALSTYWIDPAYDSTGKVIGFQTKFPAGTALLQEQQVVSSGGIHEFALGIGASLNDKFMLGGAFSVPVLSYSKESTFTEVDPTDNGNNNFNFAAVDDNTTTKGVGINAKIGLIYKPSESVRLGLAFHSPTLYSLKYTYDVVVTTDAEGTVGEQSQTMQFVNDYAYDILGYDLAPGEFSYTMVTPYRAIASAAFVLHEVEDVSRQKGFITADVEYVNYKAASFRLEDEAAFNEGDKEYLESLNTAIDNAYKPAFNFRVGGELKFTTLMVRAGAAYYGNPYKNINGEKGSKLNLSGGLGYRNKGVFVDLTYVHALSKDVHFPYRLDDRRFYEGARIKSGVGNVLATVGFKF
jgi:hypothetical protein